MKPERDSVVKTAVNGLPEESASDRRTRRLITRDFVLNCMANFCFMFGSNLLLPVLPLYISHMGGSDAEIGLAMGLYSASSLLSRPIAGQLVDKGLFTLALVFGAVNSLLSSASYGFAFVVWAVATVRLLHGFGFTSFTTATMYIAAEIAPSHRRGEAVGIFGIATNTSVALGPAIGLMLLNYSGFPFLFGLSSFLALMALMLSMRVRPPRVAVPTPVPLKLVNREALLPAIVVITGTTSIGIAFAFVPVYAARNELSNAGLFFTTFALSMIASRLVAGKLSDIHGRSAVVVPGLAMMSAAMLYLSMGVGFWGLLAVGSVLGFGLGATDPALLAMSIDRARPGERGSAVATAMAAFDGGVAIGMMMGGAILENSGFAVLFSTGAAASFLSIIVLLFGSRRRG